MNRLIATWVTCGLLAAPAAVMAAEPSVTTNVLYKAFGSFSQPQVSGNDLFKLQGEPFSINVVASGRSKPVVSGQGYAVYSPFPMTGTVKSGLLSSPTNIQSHSASIELQAGPAGETFTVATPIKVIGLTLTIHAVIQLPPGTLANLYIHPFNAPVRMAPGNATMTYSEGSESTVLGINGTLSAMLDTGASGPVQTAGALPVVEETKPAIYARRRDWLSDPLSEVSAG